MSVSGLTRISRWLTRFLRLFTLNPSSICFKRNWFRCILIPILLVPRRSELSEENHASLNAATDHLKTPCQGKKRILIRVDLTLRIHVALTCLRCSIRCFCLKEAVRQGTAEDGSPSIEKCCSPWSLDCDNPFLSLPGDPFVSDQYLVSHCSVYQCPTDTGSGARFEPRPLYPVWNLG